MYLYVLLYNVLHRISLKAIAFRCLAPWWLSGGFLGHGLQGEPVALERLGRCSWPKLCNKLDFEVLFSRLSLDFMSELYI